MDDTTKQFVEILRHIVQDEIRQFMRRTMGEGGKLRQDITGIAEDTVETACQVDEIVSLRAHEMLSMSLADNGKITKAIDNKLEAACGPQGIVYQMMSDRIAGRIGEPEPTDFEYEKVAEAFDVKEIASYIDLSDVAGNLDLDDLADELDLNDLADEIDMDDLSNRLDMETALDSWFSGSTFNAVLTVDR